MKTPAPSIAPPPFATNEEEETFKEARKQFVEKGRLDALIDLLTSGKSLSPRIGVEIARMLKNGQNQPDKATMQSGVAYALVVKAFKDSPGRPPNLDKQARLEAGARSLQPCKTWRATHRRSETSAQGISVKYE